MLFYSRKLLLLRAGLLPPPSSSSLTTTACSLCCGQLFGQLTIMGALPKLLAHSSHRIAARPRIARRTFDRSNCARRKVELAGWLPRQYPTLCAFLSSSSLPLPLSPQLKQLVSGGGSRQGAGWCDQAVGFNDTINDTDTLPQPKAPEREGRREGGREREL